MTESQPHADFTITRELVRCDVALDGKASPVPLPTFEDGLRHVRFADAAIVSARHRAWVEIADMKTTTLNVSS